MAAGAGYFDQAHLIHDFRAIAGIWPFGGGHVRAPERASVMVVPPKPYIPISTATGNTSGIGKQLWDYTLRLVLQNQNDDQFFGVIYSIDDEDDPWSEATCVKANPGWGQSVQPDAVRAIMRIARNNPAREAAARTRHLNVWVGADEALFSTRAWQACANPELSLDDYTGRRCHLALDLASKTDLAALAIVFAEGLPTGRSEGGGYAVFANRT